MMAKWLLILGLLLPTTALSAPTLVEVAPTEIPADVTAQVPEDPTETDEVLPFKLSLPTEEDAENWKHPGFRLQLAIGYGMLRGIQGAPNLNVLPILVRIGTRLDADWSIFGSLALAPIKATSGFSGLRFAGTVDPTWHATDHLDIALGFGFGGLTEGNTGRPEPNAEQRASLVASYTFPSASPPIVSCSGMGVTGLARVSWMWVLGPLSATGFAAQMDGQWTACVETLTRVEEDTARPIVRRQWWANAGGSLTWVISWH